MKTQKFKASQSGTWYTEKSFSVLINDNGIIKFIGSNDYVIEKLCHVAVGNKFTVSWDGVNRAIVLTPMYQT